MLTSGRGTAQFIKRPAEKGDPNLPQGTMKYLRKCVLRERELAVQELCESRGGRPGLSVLMSFTVSVDVKQY